MPQSNSSHVQASQVIQEKVLQHPLFVKWPDGLIVLDSRGIIAGANAMALQLLGYSSEALQGQLLHALLCGQTADYQHNEQDCPFSFPAHKLPINGVVDSWFVRKNGVFLHVDIKYVAQLTADELRLDDDYAVLSFQDCSLRRYSEKELQRLALFAELNPAPIVEISKKGLIYFSNPAMINLIAELGFDNTGMPCMLPDNLAHIVGQCLETGVALNNVEVASHGRWFLWNFYPVSERAIVQGYGMDITWRKEFEEQLFSEKERFLVTLNAIEDAVITVDTNETITYMNPKATEMTGWENIEAIGRPFGKMVNLFNSEAKTVTQNYVRRAIDECVSCRLPDNLLLAHRDGYVIAVKEFVSPMRNQNSEVVGAVVALHDITEAKKMEQSLTYQATHDVLTGLINRAEFEIRLRQSIERAKTDKLMHVLLYLDLDNFKIINDTCGHIAGDQLLRQITKLLEEKLRRGDTLARLGGDEFGAILEGCPVERATLISSEICNAIQRFDFIWEAHTFNVGVSIGLVPIDEAVGDVDQLLSLADSSCYAAKDLGKNRVHVYQDDDVDVMRKKGEMQWVSKINKALQEDRFELFFQTIEPVNCEDDGLHFEILLRMRDEHGNLIPPGAFLPAAEHYDLIKILDHWVVRSTFNWLNANPEYTCQIGSCSINLSGNSIGDEHFMHHLKEHFRNCLFPAEKICFEVTETAAIQNLSVASLFIDTIKELGCSFSLDDFGSGMSSFGYLKQLNIDYLKIDGLFVKDIVIDPVDEAMVRSINEVGHMMSLKTVAEYVENDDILSVIKALGVDYAQGYGLSRPRPIAEIAEVLQQRVEQFSDK